ncbi:TRAP transporter small permease [Thioclava sp. BHET1]|nr:TRAP transporter small permease [Thioclava sp. BHET1]
MADVNPAEQEGVPIAPGAAVPYVLLQTVRAMGAFGAVLVLVLAVLINTDIISRFAFNRPLNGIAELVELCIVIVVFIQLPLAVATGSMIRSAELHERVARRFKIGGQFLSVVFEIGGAVVLVGFAVGIWPNLVDAWSNNLYKGQPGIFTVPLWPAVAASMIGTVLASVCFLASATRRILLCIENRRSAWT